MEYTHVRVKMSDYKRIKDYVDRLNKTIKIGHVSQTDVISIALDALDKNKIKTEVSFAGTKETSLINP